jgi:hypothetical protein
VDYVFRIKTKAVFEEGGPYYVFDFFVLEDEKFDEYFLFENLWRETLLIHKLYKDHLLAVEHAQENLLPQPILRTLRVKQFGQMPTKVIFREVEELSGITLEEYLQTLIDLQKSAKEQVEGAVEAGTGIVTQQSHYENPLDYLTKSKKTVFSELEAIDMILRIVDLVNDTLHSKDIVHTNLSP